MWPQDVRLYIADLADGEARGGGNPEAAGGADADGLRLPAGDSVRGL